MGSICTTRPQPPCSRILACAVFLLVLAPAAAGAGSLPPWLLPEPLSAGSDLAQRQTAVLALLDEGRWEEAEAEQRGLVDTLSQAGIGADAGDLSAAQNNLAVLLSRLSRHGEAEPLLARAVAQRSRMWGESDPRTARLMRNLAAVQWRGGQLSRAETTLGGGAEARTAGPGRRQSATLLLWLGALYREMAPARAEATLRKALQLSSAPDPLFPSEQDQTVALCREELALLLREHGHFDEAAVLAKAVLSARRQALPPSDPGLLRIVRLLAAIEQQRGHVGAAEQLLEQALAAVSPGERVERGPDPALLLLRMQLSALWIGPTQKDRPMLAGPAMAVVPHLQQGLHLLAQSLSVLASYGHQVLPEAPAPAVGPIQSGIQAAGAVLLGTLLRRPTGSELSPELFAAVLRIADAPELAGQMREHLLPPPSPTGPGHAENPPTLRLLLRQRSERLLQAPDENGGPPTVSLQRLGQLITAAEKQAAATDPHLRELLLLRDADVGDVEQVLSRDHAALLVVMRALVPPEPPAPRAETVLTRNGVPLPPLRMNLDQPEQRPAAAKPPHADTEEHYVALLGEAQKPPRLIDLGEVAPVSALVDQLSRQADAGRDIQDEMNKLGEALLAPLAPLLLSARRLYLRVPPELYDLPWSALPLPDGKLLCSRAVVQPIDGVASLLSRPSRAPRPERVLQPIALLGAPLLRDAPAYPPPYSAVRSIPTLPGPGELIDLSHLLRQHRYDPRGIPVIGLAATKTRLDAWLPARIVHVLAPLLVGLPEPERSVQVSFPLAELLPARSTPHLPMSRASIALAGFVHATPASKEVYDPGLLSPEDLGRLDLRDTALLVLSGPLLPSGRGAGAGLLGLHRAGHRAGAEGVLTTLWRPPEPAARKLMADLYQAWLRSGNIPEAVQRVQLAMQQKGLPPLYYAGLAASATH